MSAADGSFLGVAMGALRVAYFEHLFSSYDLGAGGSITLLRADGLVLARRSAHRPVTGKAQGFPAQVFGPSESGNFVEAAAMGRHETLFAFQRVGSLPLVVVVSAPTTEIDAAWHYKAISIGVILTALCGATMGLCLWSRHELLRRLAAEESLAAAAGKLELLAATDGLTGLANRREFESVLGREWARAARVSSQITLLLLDVDAFKAFNDTYGHTGGDNVLREVAACVRSAARRPFDLAARYGGEEFAVLLPGTAGRAAISVAEALCAAIAGLKLPHSAYPLGYVTVSIGLATLSPVAGSEPAMVVRAADSALYRAKAQGRNRVAVAAPAPAPTPAPTAAEPPHASMIAALPPPKWAEAGQIAEAVS